MALPLRVVPAHRGDAVVLVRVDRVDHRIGQYLRALALGRLHRVDGVVHGPDRADRLAVVVAAAGRTPVPRRHHARLRDRHQVVAVRVHDGRERGVAVRPGHHVRRIRPRPLGRRLPCGILRSRDAHGLLRAAVVRLDVVVADRPVAPHAVGRTHAEVHRQVAPAGGCPVPGRATDGLEKALLVAAPVRTVEAHVVVGREIERHLDGGRLRIEPVVVVAQPALERDVAPVLDDARTIEARTGIQDEHRTALPRQLLGDQRADHAGADDHDVRIDVAVMEDRRIHRALPADAAVAAACGTRAGNPASGGGAVHHAGPPPT